MDLIENRTLDEIKIGDRAEIQRVLTQPDIALFAMVSADINPATLVDGEEEGPELTQGIAHGMWAGTLISAVLATRLPGPGTVHLGQTLTFHRPVNVGDRIVVRVEVTGIDKATGQITLDCTCANSRGRDDRRAALTRKDRARTSAFRCSGSGWLGSTPCVRSAT